MNTHKAILGLDVAQASVAYHLIDTNNKLLARGTAAASHAGLDKLKSAVASHKLAWEELIAAVESTGVLHLPWCEKLQALGARLYVLNPLIAKRTSALPNAIRDNQTDPVDASTLAELLAREHHRLERFRYQSPGGLFKLQRLQNARTALRANLTNLKKTLGSLQMLAFPELRALGLGDKAQRKIIQAAPTPARVLELDEATLKKLARAKAPALRKAAAESFAPPTLSEASVPALTHLAQSIDALEEQLERMDKSVEQQAQETLGAQLLGKVQTLPGFGRKTSVTILANIPAGLLAGTQSRRQLANKIQAHFGCDPRLRESGTWKGKVKLSKRGCRQGRLALYQAAMCAVMNNKPTQAIYKKLKARGKHHKVALFDIARRLIRRLVAVIAPLLKTHPVLARP